MANPKLLHLREKLQVLMADDKDGDLRPFVCDGNPFDHKIFLVGLNPVTAIENFWNYWDDSYGFCKELWLKTYMQKKAEQGKRITPTRRYLNLISETAGAQCLETDIYSKPTAKIRDLPEADRKTDIFDCLIETIRPRFLLVYGLEAVQHFEAKAKRSLQLDRLSDVNLHGIKTSIYPCKHLAAVGWSNEKAISVGRLLGQKASQ